MNKLKELENKIEELSKELERLNNFIEYFNKNMQSGYKADLIEKLQKENKELKADLYSANSIINEYIGTFKYFIPNQKVEDKIKELENANWYCESVKNQTIRALKELLEESEENK